ncbi:hypothetical protein HRbin17_00192 [bacterium HR17]|jgi:hypothetical protein|uniref:DUF3106 domain-containing protein n=1 Tax=Candidatus Fervidibacter japonicus TaxID=2035412 RepID=A0A2H5X934_9BACT|nr:hypothetical protein HRbin17_00192 [bacterium HR17]
MRRWAFVMASLWSVAIAGAQPPAPNPQWQQFREQHKYHFQLRETFYKIGELEKKGGQTALTKEQAKKLLDIFKPLTQKDKLTADEAKDALRRIKAVLRPDQLNALQRIQLPRWGGRQGGPGGGPGGSGGGPAGGGPGGMRFDPSRMQNFNPLSVKVDEKSPAAEFQKRRAQRVKEVLALLEKKAKGH